MCEFGGNHPDIRIIACTRNIKSGRFTGRNLAIAFANRGLAYKSKGQWDRAIADYDEAIRLNPDLAETFTNRGTAYYYKGQLGRALKDYDEAIRLKPNFGCCPNLPLTVLIYPRGYPNFIGGRKWQLNRTRKTGRLRNRLSKTQ